MPQFIWIENIKLLMKLFEKPSTTIMGSTLVVQGIVYSVNKYSEMNGIKVSYSNSLGNYQRCL